MKSKRIFLIIILFVAALNRFIFLDRLPSGISNDELHFVMNSKSVFYRFTNLLGNWSPLSFTTIPRETSSELTYLFIAPFVGPLPTNLFTARFPYVLIGIVTILLIYQLTLKLSKRIDLSLLTALVAALNPWGIYVSRTSFDAPLAIMFFTACLLLMTSTKPKNILLSVIPGILGFYCYIGTKVIYFPFVFVSAFFLWRYFQNGKYLKHYLFVTTVSLVLTFGFFLSLSRQAVGLRTSELWTPNSTKILDLVTLERNQSLQSPLKPFLTNKYIVYLRNFTQKYLNNFSTDILFLNGDHTFMVSLWKHGYFYYLDFVLIILGFIFLYQLNPKFLYLILTLIALSPIPEAVRSDTIPAYAFHSSFQYPFIYILIAAGFIFLWQRLKYRYLRVLFVLLYLISFINFIDIYFFKYPVYQPEGFSFSRRVAIKYIDLESQRSSQIYFLTSEPYTLFKSYLFYTNSYSPSEFIKVRDILTNSLDNITFKNIHFLNDPKLLPEKQDYLLLADSTAAFPSQEGTKLSIKRLSDAGDIFFIYRGQACLNTKLGYFTHNLNIFNLNIESQNSDKFCEKFISQTF